MLNTWSVSFTAVSIALTKQCKIKVKFGVVRNSVSAQFNLNSGINYLPTEANCTVDFNGSAIKEDVFFAILNENRFSNENSSVQVSPPYYEPSGLALCPLVSPLSWFLQTQGLLPIDYTSNKLPDAIVSEYVRASAKTGAKLSRVFEYGECMESIVKTPTGEAWKKALPNLSRFVASCTLPESQYYAREIGLVWKLQSLPTKESQEAQTLLINAFPSYAPFFSQHEIPLIISQMAFNHRPYESLSEGEIDALRGQLQRQLTMSIDLTQVVKSHNANAMRGDFSFIEQTGVDKKDYFQGHDPGGEHVEGHQTKMNVCPFRSK